MLGEVRGMIEDLGILFFDVNNNPIEIPEWAKDNYRNLVQWMTAMNYAVSDEFLKKARVE